MELPKDFDPKNPGGTIESSNPSNIRPLGKSFSLTNKDITVLLLGLRALQRLGPLEDEFPDYFAEGEEPPTDEEIDDLCERLNT